MNQTLRVCDGCIEALLEEGFNPIGSEEYARRHAAALAVDIGSDIPDHYCDRSEGERCECGCRVYADV